MESFFQVAPSVYRLIYFKVKKVSDQEILDFTQKVVEPGDVVIDVGANIGFFSSQVAKMVGRTGRVFAFEPNSKNYELLKKNSVGFNQVKTIQSAVSESSGKIALYQSHINVDFRCYPLEDGQEPHEWVPMVSLGEFFVTEKIRPKLIKVDVQGFEPFVIRGMSAWLAQNEVTLVMEFWPYAMRRAGVDPLLFLKELESFNIKFLKNDFQFYSDYCEHNDFEKYTDLIVSLGSTRSH